MPGPKILIVDDEKEICEVTKNFLGRRNYDCYTANSGKEALEMAKQVRPELVLLDVRLGEVSGLEILPQIKALNQDTKVVMVTGLADAESVKEAKAQGALDVLAKPFSFDYLCDFLSKKLAE
ncbi:MAG: response regulator [Candidatus Omnitrophica bacterium]|nr:response regulator [Candidatus Omnitrophota bacterium]